MTNVRAEGLRLYDKMVEAEDAFLTVADLYGKASYDAEREDELCEAFALAEDAWETWMKENLRDILTLTQPPLPEGNLERAIALWKRASQSVDDGIDLIREARQLVGDIAGAGVTMVEVEGKMYRVNVSAGFTAIASV